jgi:tetratricopeptide (TPR) repeat protein
VVAVAFGVREQPGVPVAEVLARVLARQQQLLLVLGNCEHVIGAAAALCGRLLQACDDVRVLATSWEPLRIAGEAAYRLAPLPVPDPDDADGVAGAEAVSLFSDRARAIDASFALTGENRRDVARLVVRLDGMPLAIELASARVEALGVVQLLDRLDGRLARPGPDGRMRYGMLETLRSYAAGLLAQAGKQDQAQAALARYAVSVAGEAAAGLQTTTGEPAAARWLDAEDATMGHVLGRAVEHDLDTAVRLVTALSMWWVLRGLLAGQEPLLRELAGRAEPGSDGWCAAQFWLARTAEDAPDLPAALERYTAVIDVIKDRGPSRMLVDCLARQSVTVSNLGRVPEAARYGRRALAASRELGYRSGRARATTGLVIAALYAGDLDDAVQLARQAGQIPDIPGTAARVCSHVLAAALAGAGDLAAAEQACAAGPGRCG